jgi:hypothetical protein
MRAMIRRMTERDRLPPGATIVGRVDVRMTAVIGASLDEVREAGKVRGPITERHIEIIETALANVCFAASNDPVYVGLWDDLVAVMRRRDRTVKSAATDMLPHKSAGDSSSSDFAELTMTAHKIT